MAKWVYMFTEGNATMRNLLGGKGANLAEMTSLGLPVPQGFTVTTEACTQYYEDGRKINDEIMDQIMDAIVILVPKRRPASYRRRSRSPALATYHAPIRGLGDSV